MYASSSSSLSFLFSFPLVFFLVLTSRVLHVDGYSRNLMTCFSSPPGCTEQQRMYLGESCKHFLGFEQPTVVQNLRYPPLKSLPSGYPGDSTIHRLNNRSKVHIARDFFLYSEVSLNSVAYSFSKRLEAMSEIQANQHKENTKLCNSPFSHRP